MTLVSFPMAQCVRLYEEGKLIAEYSDPWEPLDCLISAVRSARAERDVLRQEIEQLKRSR